MNEAQENPISQEQMELPGEPIVMSPPKSGFSKKRIVFVVVALIIVAGLGFGAALYTSKDTSTAPEPIDTSTDTNQSTTQESTTTDIPTTTVMKTYKSDFPRIEFTHPENWTVTEDTEQEGIRIESPEFSYTTINGSTVDGVFRIYIRQGARQVDSTYIGRGIAAQATETIAYSDPASDQRPETNLSFFGLDNAENFAYYLIAGNFVLQKGESLGPEYGREPETYIIAGGYSSKELTDDLAMNQVPLDEFSQTNAYKQSLEIIKSLQLL